MEPRFGVEATEVFRPSSFFTGTAPASRAWQGRSLGGYQPVGSSIIGPWLLSPFALQSEFFLTGPRISYPAAFDPETHELAAEERGALIFFYTVDSGAISLEGTAAELATGSDR